MAFLKVSQVPREALHITKDTVILGPAGSESLVAANGLHRQHQLPPALPTTKSGLASYSGFCLHVINV